VTKLPSWVIPLLSLILNFVVLLVVLSKSSGDLLVILVEWTVLALVSFWGFLVLGKMANGEIDISTLLSEAGGGGASFSRFQFLVFTFVIALSLFLVIVHEYKFPDKIPPEILTLLGISASTYAVSKGIQATDPAKMAKK